MSSAPWAVSDSAGVTSISSWASGIARAALEGALEQIAGAGAGLVEAVCEVTVGRPAQDRLFSGTVELFGDLGFARVRQVGKHAWTVSRTVAAPPTNSISDGRMANVLVTRRLVR